MANQNNDDDVDETRIVESDTFRGRLEEASKAPPCLVVLVGPTHYQGKLWALTESEYIIGRSVDSSIFIDDKSVSKSHAKIKNNNGEIMVMDLDSTNKTIVNGKILPPLITMKLENNDQIKIGNVIFKFHEEGSLETISNQYNFDLRLKDSLTGIFNKGGLQTKADEAFKRAKLLNAALSIVVFDLDFFKKINDTFGHSAGDYVLKEMSVVVQNKVIRSGDIFARYGGEEFVVILSDTRLPRATEIAERIRTTIESHLFNYEGNNLKVTVSAGVATRTPQTSSWEELFRAADIAAYRSKQNGRNKVTAAA